MSYIAEAGRLYILITLLVSALGKSLAFEQFRANLVDSFHVPQSAGVSVAFVIVGIEWLILCLLIGRSALTFYGLVAALILFIIFTAVLGVTLFRREKVFCNCFGRSSRPMSAYDLIRNGTLIGACAIGLLFYRVDSEIPSVAYITLVGVALMTFFITTSLQEIAQLIRVPTEGQDDG